MPDGAVLRKSPVPVTRCRLIRWESAGVTGTGVGAEKWAVGLPPAVLGVVTLVRILARVLCTSGYTVHGPLVPLVVVQVWSGVLGKVTLLLGCTPWGGVHEFGTSATAGLGSSGQ